MKKAAIWILAVVLVVSLTSCASKEKKIMAGLDRPVDCTTAEGDIRVLKSEKAHTGEQIGMGVASIVPASAVIAILSGTWTTQAKIATGEYDKMIDARIKKIQETCNVQ